MDFKILAVGDVCGESGLNFLCRRLRGIKQQYGIDFCAVNGENASVVGLTGRQAEEMLDAGADVITLGNHSFGRREIASFLEDSPYILRPANLSPLYPGRGLGVYDTRVGELAVLNPIGRCGMDFGPDNPFLLTEKLLKTVKTKLIVADLHAEATSEKLAFGYAFDGQLSAVWGTHTHVPTADDGILPKGTGFVTDLGMTGPRFSVLGIRPEQSVATFRGGLTTRFESAPGPCKLEAVAFTLDTVSGRCVGTERVMIYEDENTARR